MRRDKKELLKKRGWEVGSAEEFLELSTEEAELVERLLGSAQRRPTEHLRGFTQRPPSTRVTKA